jgi:peroxiredoxin
MTISDILLVGRETFFIGQDGIIKDVCVRQIRHKPHIEMVERCLRAEIEKQGGV